MIKHTKDVHGEGNQSVVFDEDGEEVDPVDDDPELLHESLPVEEVVGGDEEIPGEGPEPGKIVHLVNCVADVDDLRKTLQKFRWCLFFSSIFILQNKYASP